MPGGFFFRKECFVFMKGFSVPSILCLVLIISCSREPLPELVVTAYTPGQWLSREAETLAASLTQRQRAAQVLMTGIDGKHTFPPHLWAHFEGIVPGAILLFGYNIADTPEKVHAYLASCSHAFGVPGGSVTPFFAIDHEGGSVFRLSGITSSLPSAARISRTLPVDQTEKLYAYSGTQLRLLGFTMNLAPVAEVLSPSNAPFLANRSFDSDPDRVIAYAAAAVRGYRRSGVLPVLKHYPGNTDADPHSFSSSLDIPDEEFDSVYRYPFRTLFSRGAPAVLLSHIRLTTLDPDVPFCLSPAGVTGILRNGDAFSGLVITDDISMGALADGSSSSAENAVQAIRSGCDMVMTSDTDIQAIVSAIEAEARKDAVFDRRLEEAVVSILRAKFDTGIVYTARQRYARSRLGRDTVASTSSFCTQDFIEAGKQATLILENSHEHD